MTTPRLLLDSARSRHWAFSPLAGGDGAALLFLRQRLTTHVAMHGPSIEGLIGTTVQYVVPVTPPALLITTSGAILTTQYGESLVVAGSGSPSTTPDGNAGLGTPTMGGQYQDGWPVHLSVDHVPYVDFSEPPIAADPFGRSGGTVGFPLPAEMVRLISVGLVYGGQAITGTGSWIPCDIIPESQRFTTLPGRNPACFVSANRLIPVLPQAGYPGNATNSRWDSVTAISISYVGVQTLRTLDDALNLPNVLAEALIADLAVYFAMLSKEVPTADKQLFLAEQRSCGAAIASAALGLLQEPEHRSVAYLG